MAYWVHLSTLVCFNYGQIFYDADMTGSITGSIKELDRLYKGLL